MKVVAAWMMAALLASASAAQGQSATLPGPPAVSLTSPLLDAGPDAASRDGNLSLLWRLPDSLADPASGRRSNPAATRWSFQVEERIGEVSTMIDAGAYLSTALSGREDGVYQYRVRALDADGTPGPWSAPIELRVNHHPLWLALLFFAIGGLVFLATATLIVAGHRLSRDPSEV